VTPEIANKVKQLFEDAVAGRITFVSAMEACSDEEALLFLHLFEEGGKALAEVYRKRGLLVPDSPLFKPPKPS
jgi:hypothetical protein